MIGRTRTIDTDFTNPNGSVYMRMMIPTFPFPEPGTYLVELFCDDEFLDDQRIQIRSRLEG